MKKILVVGANGTVGKFVLSNLKAKGINTIGATSSATPKTGEVHLDLVKQTGLTAALNGVEAAFVLSPPGYTNQDELLIPFFTAAKNAGVKKVVMMSAMGANASAESPFRKAEIFLEKSGLTFNILRPNWFMQNFNTFWISGINQQSKILLPVGNAKGSFIDARDIADCAVELLISDNLNNKDFDLTGSEALDHDQVAEILSRETGRTITYQEIPPADMKSGLLAAGVPKDYSEFLLLILGFFKEGYSERQTDSVKTITGKSPRQFVDYAEDYKTAWLPN